MALGCASACVCACVRACLCCLKRRIDWQGTGGVGRRGSRWNCYSPGQRPRKSKGRRLELSCFCCRKGPCYSEPVNRSCQGIRANTCNLQPTWSGLFWGLEKTKKKTAMSCFIWGADSVRIIPLLFGFFPWFISSAEIFGWKKQQPSTSTITFWSIYCCGPWCKCCFWFCLLSVIIWSEVWPSDPRALQSVCGGVLGQDAEP